jgi:hypothetical protein
LAELSSTEILLRQPFFFGVIGSHISLLLGIDEVK